ncbi:Ig-like domain-containing protein [Paenibacillus xerothermodurans]|uniref:BIG2 domain-containing protein n=1 Tax=Paenibacillus xerothermodurans TaxID=1977292 RepID=A0A2W1P3G2_PAEXE|nr:Ig-like domain-containing protein [Paenibacillus xerothermodurans]PZE21708.1 hypothetical protein CBW46_004630 [Paenibacillus xerothermodurans]
MNKQLWKKRWLAGALTFALTTGWSAGSAAAAVAVPHVEWEKTYDHVPGEAQSTEDGGYIMIGEPQFTHPDSFVKTDAGGKVEWAKPMHGHTIAATQDGGYITGEGGGTKVDPTFTVRKTDAVGTVQWTSTLKGNVIKYMTQIRQTRDGGFIFIGYDSVVKLDQSGQVAWRKASDDFYNLESVEQTADGGYVLGSGNSNGLHLWKLDEMGNITWTRSYLASGKGNALTGAGHAAQTPDGGYAIAGNKDGQFVLIKTDATGRSQWSKTYGTERDEYIASLRVTRDGGYLLGGYALTRKLNYRQMYENVVIQTDSAGRELWSRVMDDGNAQTETMMEQAFPTPDGGVAVYGRKTTYSPQGAYQQSSAQLIKLSPGSPSPAAGLRLDSEEYSVIVGGQLDTVVTATYGGQKRDVTKYTQFKVDNGDIVSVDAAGNITGLKYGQTVLTATYNNLEARATVYVY